MSLLRSLKCFFCNQCYRHVACFDCLPLFLVCPLSTAPLGLMCLNADYSMRSMPYAPCARSVQRLWGIICLSLLSRYKYHAFGGISAALRLAPCSMLHALCPVLYALCSLLFALYALCA